MGEIGETACLRLQSQPWEAAFALYDPVTVPSITDAGLLAFREFD